LRHFFVGFEIALEEIYIMNKLKLYSNLTKDIFNLYCLTLNSKVEDVFLRLSQTVGRDFIRWLRSDDALLVADTLHDPLLMEAFRYMMKVRSKFTLGSLDRSKFVEYIMSNPHPSITVIIELANFLGDPEVGYLLEPFEDIIQIAATMKSEKPRSSHSVLLDDLVTLRDKFTKKEATKEPEDEKGDVSYVVDPLTGKRVKVPIRRNLTEQRKDMFYGLYTRFSEDIAMAAENSGFSEFAQALRTRGILGRNQLLSEFIEVGETTPYIVQKAQEVSRNVLRNSEPSKFDQNYEYIKQESLFFVSAITHEEYGRLQRARQQETPIPLEGEESEEIEMPELSVDAQKWLNPYVLSMLSAVFRAMYEEIAGMRTRVRM